MYNSEDTIWTNQQLYYYSDKSFNSKGVIDITISNNTKDFKFFSPANLSIKVCFENDFKTQKTCSLSISKVLDLIKSIETLSNGDDEFNEAYEKGFDITKRYNKDRNLVIKFKRSSSTNDKCVIIAIVYNDSNFVNVIIPLEEFKVIKDVIDKFSDSYLERTKELKEQALSLKQINLLEQMIASVQSLPSYLNIKSETPTINIDSNGTTTINVEDKLDIDDIPTTELDNFLGDDMDNIKIPDIEKDQKRASSVEPVAKREIKSHLINNILNNDISVLEDILNSSYVKSNPIESIQNTIFNEITFPMKNEKSLIYLSKTMFNSMLKNYLDNDVVIPMSTPILKFNLESSSEKMEEIAIDLLINHLYLKNYRSRVEAKTDDVNLTKSITYLAFRCFMDVFYFSVLENISSDRIKTSVNERYEYFEKIGYFEKYNNTLINNGYNSISKEDMIIPLDNIITHIEHNKGRFFVDELHDSYYKNGSMKLPLESKINLEHIINDVVRLEVDRKLNKLDINNENVSDDIKKLFIENSNNDKKDKKSNLIRFINTNETEIPNDYKENLIEYVVEVGNNNIDFEKIGNRIKDLGETIIKGLYLWNEDEKVKDNYLYFDGKVRDLNMKKNDIINVLSKPKENSEWDNIDLSGF